MPFQNILPVHSQDAPRTDSHQDKSINTLSDGIEPSSSSIMIFWPNEVIAAGAEFIGTFMFLFFAFGGTQVSHTMTSDAPATGQSPDSSTLLYIALSFGFSLMVNVWVFFRVSGGLFNPAVSTFSMFVTYKYRSISFAICFTTARLLRLSNQATLGLRLIGAITTVRALLYFLAQILAGMSAAAVVEALFPGPLDVSTNLSVSIARGIFIEMFCTSMLVFTIIMLAAEKHRATYLAPIGIGLALFIAHLVAIRYTGAGLNPARSFGPCVATHSFPGYHYVYWVGPLMGSLLAIAVYKVVKLVEYEVLNPGQDSDSRQVCPPLVSCLGATLIFRMNRSVD